MQKLISLSPGDLDCVLTCASLAPLGHEFVAEAKYPMPFNPAHFFPWWRNVLKLGLGKFFVVEEDSIPVGVMGALFSEDVFSGVKQGMENFWFVSKKSRNSGRAGLRMFKAFEEECDARDCKVRLMIHLDEEGMRGEALTSLYERKGYAPAESFFRKVI